MANTEIDALELKIESNSEAAVKGLDALIDTLGRLKTATADGCGLSTIAGGLGSLSGIGKINIPAGLATAIEKIGKAANNLKGIEDAQIKPLANGLKALASVGDIKLSSSVGTAIDKISSAVKSSEGADFGRIRELAEAVKPLTQLGKSNLSSIVNPLQKLPEIASSLNKMDLSAFAAKIREVANAMKPLADEMQKVASGFAAFPAKIQKFISASNKVPSVNKASSVSFSKLATKAMATVYGLKRVVSAIASWINESNAYTENLNLFTVAMGEYADSAMQYANTVSEVMGIDTSDWIRNQGVFMTMATGFGVAGDRASTMSQQLTQLGYDISSFYNTSVEDAMQRLQSGLAGELEPLRRLGYDLSQAKLEATALSLGINKAVNSMTQAEKAELRYYAIMTQVTQVHQDMANTLDHPSNQLRVFQAQLKMAARAVGELFIPTLQKILPIGIAVAKVIQFVANAMAGLFGVTKDEGVSDALADIGANAGGVSSSIEEATDNAGKLKKMLLGIDELNVMSDTSGSDSGSGDGFGFDLPAYEFLSDDVNAQVNEIVEKMKEWLGITGDIESWSEFFDTRLGRILEKAGLIAGSFAAWKLTTGFLNAVATLKALLANPYYSIAIGVVLTIMGFSGAFGGLKDAIKNGLDGFNFGEIIGNSLLAAGGMAILGSKIATWITTTFAGSAVSNALIKAAINLFGQTTGPITAGAITATGGILLAAVTAIILGIPTYIVGIRDAVLNGIDWLSGILIPAGSTAAAAGIGAIIGACGGPIGAGIGALIGLVVGLVTDGIILVTQKGEAIVQWFRDVQAKFDGWADGLHGKISTFFDRIVDKVKGFSPRLAKFFDDLKINILYVFDSVKLSIDRFLTNTRNMIDVLNKLFNGDFAGAWASFKNMILDDLKAVGNRGVLFLNSMVASFESMVNYIIRGINRLINGFNKISWDVPDWVPGIGGKSIGFAIKTISEVSLGRIPYFADGGYPASGELFWARENGAGPELVGSIGNRSAVVNNDQIVAAVAQGVYQAVVQANAQSGNQTVEAKVNDKVLFEVVLNRNRQETMRKGYNPLMGGV